MENDNIIGSTSLETEDPMEHEGEVKESEVMNLSNTSIGEINAELVRMNQSGAQKIVGSEIELKQSAAVQVETQDATIIQGLAGTVEGVKVKLNASTVGIIRAEEVSIQDGSTGILVTESATLHNNTNGVVIANDVQADQIKTTFLLSGNVSGPVETVFDTPRALLAGITAGVAFGMVQLVTKLLEKRNMD